MVEVGQNIVLEGRSSKETGGVSEMYECGAINYVVHCPCGAKEDDGERMVSCDICEVRQHMLCVRIPDSEQVPHIFLCNRCEREIILLPSPWCHLLRGDVILLGGFTCLGVKTDELMPY
ncbi:hypothetical protein ACFX10_010909 [Malus domestica]